MQGECKAALPADRNPLDRYKRFQITCSFSSSGFILAARRAFLHLSYSYALPCGPALLVTQDPKETSCGRLSITSSELALQCGTVVPASGCPILPLLLRR